MPKLAKEKRRLPTRLNPVCMVVAGIVLEAALASCSGGQKGGSKGNNQPLASEDGPLATDDASDNIPAEDLPAPSGEVVTIADGLLAERDFVQSRTPIFLTIAPSVAGLDGSFSLFNDAASASLLIQNQPLSLVEPKGAVGYNLTTTDGGIDLRLRLFPSADEFRSKFVYGENILRLLVAEDGVPKRQTTTKFQRRDFPMFALGSGTSEFEAFDGGVAPFKEAELTNGTRVLSVGVINMLSR